MTLKLAVLSAVQAAIINNARSVADDAQRKAIKAHVFADVKAKFGLPADVPLKAQTDANCADYLVIKVGSKHANGGSVFPLDDNDKFTGTLLDQALVNAPAAAPADTRKWFRVSVDRLLTLFKDDQYLDSANAVDLPADAVASPVRDDFAADQNGTDVFVKAEPDDAS